MSTLYARIRRDAADAAAVAHLQAALLDAQGNVTRAARALGLDRRHLRRELVRLGLRPRGAQR